MAEADRTAARLSPPLVRSTLDVAFWFLDRAESAGAKLSQRKLLALLYLAQAGYAEANGGRRLMPAVFLAADAGPIEPTVFHIFQSGTPRIVAARPPATAETMLAGVWSRYGALGEDEVARHASEDPHFQSAFRREKMSEVRVAGAGRDDRPTVAASASTTPTVKPVNAPLAKKWIPGTYGPKKT